MKRNKGYTLLEVIIAIALLSAIAVLFYTVFGQGLNLFARQAESSSELTSLRQAISDITNKARLTNPASISYSYGVLHVGSSSYSFEDQTIKRNGTVIAKDISSFEVIISGGMLEITIDNLSGKSISTSISLLS